MTEVNNNDKRRWPDSEGFGLSSSEDCNQVVKFVLRFVLLLLGKRALDYRLAHGDPLQRHKAYKGRTF